MNVMNCHDTPLPCQRLACVRDTRQEPAAPFRRVLSTAHTCVSTPVMLRSTLSPAQANATAMPPASAALTVPDCPEGTTATLVPALSEPPCSDVRKQQSMQQATQGARFLKLHQLYTHGSMHSGSHPQCLRSKPLSRRPIRTAADAGRPASISVPPACRPAGWCRARSGTRRSAACAAAGGPRRAPLERNRQSPPSGRGRRPTFTLTTCTPSTR